MSQSGISRRGFVGGMATAVGLLTTRPLDLLAESPESAARRLRAERTGQ